MGSTQAVFGLLVGQIRFPVVVNAPAGALGQDADLVHGFLASFGMDLE